MSDSTRPQCAVDRRGLESHTVMVAPPCAVTSSARSARSCAGCPQWTVGRSR